MRYLPRRNPSKQGSLFHKREERVTISIPQNNNGINKHDNDFMIQFFFIRPIGSERRSETRWNNRVVVTEVVREQTSVCLAGRIVISCENDSLTVCPDSTIHQCIHARSRWEKIDTCTLRDYQECLDNCFSN